MSKHAPPTTKSLSDVLKAESGVLVLRLWPDDQGLGTFGECMAEAEEKELYESLLRHLRLMDLSLPVVAVAGLVNAGKSSTVGTFLSPAGRDRVLRGMGEEEATQRFVLWCPRSWERDEMRRTSLLDVLGTVFGTSLELLSEDPDAAHRQYNFHSGTGDAFNTPLVAFDDGLDAAEFAILDCPDVERKFPGASGEHTCRLRLDVLKKASAIASALLVVANHGGSGKEDFEHMLHAVLRQMPGIPWWLLLNMCRIDYEPHEAYKHCEKLASSLNARGVFLAFDYLHDAEEWRRRTPAPLHGLGQGDIKKRQPSFYLAESDASRNPPNPVEEDRFLSRLPEQFKATGGVGQRLKAIHARRLVEQTQNAQVRVSEYCGVSHGETRKLWEGLLRVCSRGYMDAQGQLVVPLTPATAERLQKAFVKTAPWSTRVAMKTALGLGKMFSLVIAGPKWVWQRLKHWLGKEGGKDAQRAAASVEARTFVNEMIRAGFALDALPTDENRLAAWSEVLMRHQKHQPDQLSEEELEKAMAEAWEHRGVGAKVLGLAGPMVLVLILVAFALVPTDGGATLAVVLAKLGVPAAFTLKAAGAALAYQVAGFLSVSEILLALGATAAAAPVGGYLLEKMMRKRLALPALANLFACACDLFGLPRIIGGAPVVDIQGTKYPLPPAKAERGAVLCPLRKESVWEFQPAGWQRLSADMQALATDAERPSNR
jgi:hypothetical protein